jgi:hypothetical protein
MGLRGAPNHRVFPSLSQVFFQLYQALCHRPQLRVGFHVKHAPQGALNVVSDERAIFLDSTLFESQRQSVF